MGFLNYLVRRLALVLPTLFGVSLICFFLTYILPGNPAMVKAGPFATAEHLAEMEHQMGLDRSVPEQYFRYVTGLFHGDLGESSSTGRPVSQDFIQRLPATLELNFAALLIAIVIGISLGVLSAVHRDTFIDHLGRVVGITGVAMPSFWTGLLFVYVFFYLLNLAPPPLGRLGSGITPPAHITGLYVVDFSDDRQLDRAALQPASSDAAGGDPWYQRHGTGGAHGALHHARNPEFDYIKAAWAAGLPRRTVIYGDALRNAMIPVITILGIVFGFLMAGNAVVESVFAWPGIGNYAVTALMT